MKILSRKCLRAKFSEVWHSAMNKKIAFQSNKP